MVKVEKIDRRAYGLPPAPSGARTFAIGKGPASATAPALAIRAHHFMPLEGSEPVPLLMLKEHRCKWPVGEDPAMFCGLPAAQKARKRPNDPVTYGPYCAAHKESARAKRQDNDE